MAKFTISEKTPTKTCSCWKFFKTTFCALSIFFVLLGIFVAILSINAYFLTDGFERITLETNPVYLNLSKEEIQAQAKRLAGGIQIETISTKHKNKNQKYLQAIKDLHAYIESEYPSIHQADYIDKTVVSNYSLIYRVEGSSKNKNVYMLCGHLDVVPTPKPKLWDYDPFLGNIAPEHKCSYCDMAFDVCKGEDIKYIHGRGAIDTKNVVFGILESLENLVKTNSRPNTTFYIAFSHDEEIGGSEGSAQIKIEMRKTLKQNQESLKFLLDEGTPVAKDYFPFIKDPLIYISVTEKGWNKVKLDMNSVPYEDSMNNTSLKRERCNRNRVIHDALKKIKKIEQPFRYGDGPEYDLWRYLSVYMDHFVYRLLASNMWLFTGLISSGLIDPKQVNVTF